MTRLCRLHPYPAMLADELAEELASRFVRARDRVLDPFCGTGRTLVAAGGQGGVGLGIDVNPLALLIARAKVARARPEHLEEVLQRLDSVPRSRSGEAVLLKGRRVRWFSRKTERELVQLVDYINRLGLAQPERLLVGVVLSATVREVSYCRQDQWKLHRLSARERQRFVRSPIEVFLRRLGAVLREVRTTKVPPRSISFAEGDSRHIGKLLVGMDRKRQFDLILTSPPYGDSRTTVQYGGISGICLDVVSRIKGLDISPLASGDIDRLCLGGETNPSDVDERTTDIKRCWAGGRQNPQRQRVLSFLRDLAAALRGSTRLLRHDGRLVLVLGRRLVGGWRLYLDRFVTAALADHTEFEGAWIRKLLNKRTPNRINRYARQMASVRAGVVSTMREEVVLVLRKHRAGRPPQSRVGPMEKVASRWIGITRLR